MVNKKELEELTERVDIMENSFKCIRDVVGNVSERNLDLMSRAINRYGKINFNRELAIFLRTNRIGFERNEE